MDCTPYHQLYHRVRRLLDAAHVALPADPHDLTIRDAIRAWLSIHCPDCGTQLSFQEWMRGERICTGCYLRRAAALLMRIAEIEHQQWRAHQKVSCRRLRARQRHRTVHTLP